MKCKHLKTYKHDNGKYYCLDCGVLIDTCLLHDMNDEGDK